ncbi:2-hydroxyacid dehydrogenase [Hymenobacter sp. DH14]|uniref:2-hydroxyacid dehydrogenase n=1 Tax=Hymenobacter cyanobacteriorum TaxID=2926463 RepID=A0A9X1VHC4_9BACT|nr:2-hydroxyacid dehydrogenase [Hymenobacter cyanobacteriorum]MCI1188625.1 2-hydroxyacid dehydrogenase [Hymenobacter cyanobacteriorum]
MNVTAFSTQGFERSFLQRANQARHQLTLLDTPLSADTAHLAQGALAVSIFTRDDASAPVLGQLWDLGVRYLAVRATGTDNVDLAAARQLGLRVANVPEYSPYAIAEHAVTLMLALCRHLRQADQQLRANDFRLDHLIGFDLHGKTVAILGVGRIGGVVARILHGFGCELLGVDVQPNPELTAQYGLRYVSLAEACAQADIISVHTPLNADTQHLISDELLRQMKRGVMLINTGRGGVLDTEAALRALKTGQLGFLGLDVYEKEKALFFADHRQDLLLDDTFARLLTFPNVLLTGHQAYLTREALANIADATLASLTAWGLGQPAAHEVAAPVAQKQPVA